MAFLVVRVGVFGLNSPSQNQKVLKKKLDLSYNLHVSLNYICFSFLKANKLKKKRNVINFTLLNLKDVLNQSAVLSLRVPTWLHRHRLYT